MMDEMNIEHKRRDPLGIVEKLTVKSKPVLSLKVTKTKTQKSLLLLEREETNGKPICESSGRREKKKRVSRLTKEKAKLKICIG